jgi:hypothetical protein
VEISPAGWSTVPPGPKKTILSSLIIEFSPFRRRRFIGMMSK